MPWPVTSLWSSFLLAAFSRVPWATASGAAALRSTLSTYISHNSATSSRTPWVSPLASVSAARPLRLAICRESSAMSAKPAVMGV